MKKVLPLFIVSILVATSGCVEISGVDFAEVPMLEIGEPRYVITEKVSLTSRPVPGEVDSGRKMDLFFDVKNEGNSTVNGVKLKLLDKHLLSYRNDNPNESREAEQLDPGEMLKWKWELEANDVDMERNSEIRHELSYNSRAFARFTLTAIDEDEYLTRTETGTLEEVTELTYEKTQTPIEVMVEVPEDQPIPEGEDFIVHLDFENKGDGSPVGDSLSNINLTYPDGLFNILGDCQGRMEVVKDGEIKLADELVFRDSKAPRISCKFKVNDDIRTVNSGVFEVNADYDYKEYGKTEVTVTP